MRCVSLFAVAVVCISCGANYPGERLLVDLRQKLERTQHEYSKTCERILRLEEAIAKKEIERIEWEIGQVDVQKVVEHSHFFSDQREVLSMIIHHHPSCAEQAQDKASIFL